MEFYIVENDIKEVCMNGLEAFAKFFNISYSDDTLELFW